jgi:hypothetical protein
MHDIAYDFLYDFLHKMARDYIFTRFFMKCVDKQVKLEYDRESKLQLLCMQIVHKRVRGIVHEIVHVLL